MHKTILLLFSALFFISSCGGSSNLRHSDAQVDAKKGFIQEAELHPEKIWPAHLNPRTQKALKDYQSRVILDNGLIYGNSVRNFSLEKQSVNQIDRHFQQIQCKR